MSLLRFHILQIVSKTSRMCERFVQTNMYVLRETLVFMFLPSQPKHPLVKDEHFMKPQLTPL